MKKVISMFLVLAVICGSLVFATVTTNAATSNNWQWPTNTQTISANWPKYSGGSYHSGVDFAASANSPVYSTCDGEVVKAVSLTNSYGKHVKIRATVNGETVYMYYCHLNDYYVSAGDRVVAGQQIGISGSTGNSTGPHLHYEVRNSNDYYGSVSSPNLNPWNFLPGSNNTFETWNNEPTPVDIGDDFYAFIINTEMWKHLTVEQDNNVDIRTEKAHHCADQVWNFLRQSDGSYKIISLANGRCLDVEDNSSVNYANVTVWPDNDGNNQRWFIYGEAPYYKLKAKCTDCVLDVNENCSDDGTNIQMFYDHGGESQQFQIYTLDEESYAIDKGNDFTAPIFNLKNGMALENDNGNVVIKKETGMSKQVWRFERQKDGSYKISSCFDGKCMDVYDASHANGANVQVYGSNGNDNQRWYLYEANNYVMFQSKESGYFLDLYEGLDIEGTNIEVWYKNVDDPQIFNIYKGEECKLRSTTLTITESENNECVFTWHNVYAKTGYDLKIWKDEVWNGDAYQIIWGAKSGESFELPAGTYQAYVDAYNHYDCKMSNVVTFVVEEKYILGDADSDGNVTSIDVTLLQRVCAHMETGIGEDVLMNGDVDGSGVLEIIDATWMQRHLAKMDTPYAIGEAR